MFRIPPSPSRGGFIFVPMPGVNGWRKPYDYYRCFIQPGSMYLWNSTTSLDR